MLFPPHYNSFLCKIELPFFGNYFQSIWRKTRHVFASKIRPDERKNLQALRLISVGCAFRASSSCEWALLTVRLRLNHTAIRYSTASNKIEVTRGILLYRWLLDGYKRSHISRISGRSKYVFKFAKPGGVFVKKNMKICHLRLCGSGK